MARMITGNPHFAVNGDPYFTIKHYAGSVVYSVDVRVALPTAALPAYQYAVRVSLTKTRTPFSRIW
jgi:hypothetical protein